MKRKIIAVLAGLGLFVCGCGEFGDLPDGSTCERAHLTTVCNSVVGINPFIRAETTAENIITKSGYRWPREWISHVTFIAGLEKNNTYIAAYFTDGTIRFRDKNSSWYSLPECYSAVGVHELIHAVLHADIGHPDAEHLNFVWNETNDAFEEMWFECFDAQRKKKKGY